MNDQEERERKEIFERLQKFVPMTGFAQLLKTNRRQALIHITDLFFILSTYSDLKEEHQAYEIGDKEFTPNYLKSDRQLAEEYEVLCLNCSALLQVRHLAEETRQLIAEGRIEEARQLIVAAGGDPSF